MTIRPILLILILLLAADQAEAADIAAGEKVFARCKICHTIEAGGRNTVGPNLHGLFGRKAGSLPNYEYSQAMKNSGITWDGETLKKYLARPKTFLPGDKMAFPGVKNPQELADLIAYLKEATK
jgi:cytochrome c